MIGEGTFRRPRKLPDLSRRGRCRPTRATHPPCLSWRSRCSLWTKMNWNSIQFDLATLIRSEPPHGRLVPFGQAHQSDQLADLEANRDTIPSPASEVATDQRAKRGRLAALNRALCRNIANGMQI